MPEPLRTPSWLELERHVLGELEPSRSAEIAAVAERDPEVRACLDEIERVRSLPPLPASRPAASWLTRLRVRWPLAAAAAALATAAVVLLLVRSEPDGTGAGGVRTKGGDAVTVELVRERSGGIAHAPRTFATGDRFKVLVTCGGTARVTGEIEIRQGDDIDRPLQPVDVRCGNRVVVPGAFRLTGDRAAEVCLVPDDDRGTSCTTLIPK